MVLKLGQEMFDVSRSRLKSYFHDFIRPIKAGINNSVGAYAKRERCDVERPLDPLEK